MNRVKEIDPEGLLVMDDPSQPRFKRFEGAFGWRDPQGTDHEARHALLIGGEMEDGRFVVLEETQGDILPLLTETINAKDRLLLKRLACDASDPQIMRLVYEQDGLTGYRDLNPGGDKPIWETPQPGTIWPDFRDRFTKCAVVGVPAGLRSSPVSGVDRLVRLGLRGQNILKIDGACQQTLEVWDEMKKQLVDIQDHPIFKALVNLLWAYETFGDPPERSLTFKHPMTTKYPNRRM